MESWNEKLLTAALKGDIEAFTLSLQNGADINYQDDRGLTALMCATQFGHLEICKLLIDRGCKIDITMEKGWTALMFAAFWGHLEVCKLLIDRGCKMDITNSDGETALHWAAIGGHLLITRCLVEQGDASPLVTTRKGNTPYDLAAATQQRQYKKVMEYLQTVMSEKSSGVSAKLRIEEPVYQLKHVKNSFLEKDDTMTVQIYVKEVKKDTVEVNMTDQTFSVKFSTMNSQFLNLHKDTTNDTIFNWEVKLKHEIVPEKCRYKISPSVLEITLSKEVSRRWSALEAPQREVDVVPTEIKLMADKRSIDLYLKLLESGSEKKRDIRLVVVGKQGAGKTSLIRRLFGEDITDVTSTNGIEIHKIKCKAMSDDGIWNKLDGTNEETEMYARLLKQFKETIGASVEEVTHEAVKENTPSTSFDESETVTQPKKREIQVPTESKVKPPATSQQPNLSLEQAKTDIETMLKSKVDLHDKEEYANLLLWDFAGDEEFYHTHQTFLSQDAIYLVVTKLNEADDKNAQEMFQLWMNSIHCYCRLDDQKNKAESNTGEIHERMIAKDDWLDPPVVLVGSHRDKVEPSSGKTIEDACRDCLDKYVEDVSADARRHISDQYEYFISSTEDNSSVFQLIRQNLLNLATTMKTWNQDYPIKFIQLEKCLQEKKKELPIISFNEIKQISTEIPNPLNHEELMLYLKFHHELRALVYFEDLLDYIILDTQWLSDAFKCIITAKKFQYGAKRYRFNDEWNDLNIRGLLHSVVLDQILETNTKIFKFEEKQNLFQHKDHILKVMEKFDIIIRPTVSDRDDTDTKPSYYIPCMVKEVPDCPINEQFNVTEKNCTKSTWLCFKFKFLPGHLMNHLIASLSRKYEIAEVPVRGQKKRPIALFRGTVVFKLQKTSKLLVKRYPNVIQIQVWDFGKHCNIDRCLFKDIDDFVTREINTIIRKRFKMTTVKFDKMLGCSLAEPDCVTGFYEQDADYFCDICTETHISEWSDDEPIQNTGIYEKKPKQRGLVLIVNFMFSGRANERRGSDKDVNELTDFFRKELDYQVENRSDMTKSKLQDCFNDIESEYLTEKSTDYHSFVCIVMSHGNKKGIKTEDEHISVMEITKPFKNKPGGKFNGKPRLFLIQACRGQQKQKKVDVSNTLDQTSEHDECPGYSQSRSGTSSSSDDDYYTDGSTDIPKLPIDADIIVAFATTPGYKASRHRKLGSHFIRAFLDVARRKYRYFDVEDILRDVRQKLAENLEYEGKSGKCQMGIVESTSRKKFFF